MATPHFDVEFTKDGDIFQQSQVDALLAGLGPVGNTHTRRPANRASRERGCRPMGQPAMLGPCARRRAAIVIISRAMTRCWSASPAASSRA